jgi:hypothetical protein
VGAAAGAAAPLVAWAFISSVTGNFLRHLPQGISLMNFNVAGFTLSFAPQ